MLQLIASLGLVLGASAAILWLVEAVAKRVGGRVTWLLFLVAIPFFISLAVTMLNWEELDWWERLAYPLSGPVAAAALLFAGFAAINPADAALLLSTAVRAGWRLLRLRSGSRPR